MFYFVIHNFWKTLWLCVVCCFVRLVLDFPLLLSRQICHMHILLCKLFVFLFHTKCQPNCLKKKKKQVKAMTTFNLKMRIEWESNRKSGGLIEMLEWDEHGTEFSTQPSATKRTKKNKIKRRRKQQELNVVPWIPENNIFLFCSKQCDILHASNSFTSTCAFFGVCAIAIRVRERTSLQTSALGIIYFRRLYFDTRIRKKAVLFSLVFLSALHWNVGRKNAHAKWEARNKRNRYTYHFVVGDGFLPLYFYDIYYLLILHSI